ncbi:hypothetical protein EDC04DRAFT_2759694, partial [Pisolithus marmoratus]
MGIDVNSERRSERQPEVQYWVQLLRQRYAGMKLIVGRDKLDEIQVGVRLLHTCPHEFTGCIYRAYATSSRLSNTSSRQTRSSRA